MRRVGPARESRLRTQQMDGDSTTEPALLRQALDQTDEPLYVLQDGQFTTVNRPLLELTGYEREDVIGESPEQVYHPEAVEEHQRHVEWLEEATDDSIEWFCRIVTNGGTELPVRVEQTAVTGDDTTAIVGRVQDIRQEVQQEQKLNILTRALRHNIRNQMNLVVGHANTLQEIEDPNYRTAAETVEEVGQRVINLADKARKAHEHLDVPPEEECRVDLAETASLVVEKFGIKQPASPVTTEFPSTAPVLAPPSVDVALMELMENAAVHHPSGSGPVTVRIEAGEQTTAVHVEDECEPISDEVVEIVDRGEEQPLQHNEGLGLWIVRWITDIVNGELTFERRADDAGNRVSLRFETLGSV